MNHAKKTEYLTSLFTDLLKVLPCQSNAHDVRVTIQIENSSYSVMAKIPETKSGRGRPRKYPKIGLR